MDPSKGSAGAVAGLPDDPLVEILSRVPAKSICRFKCVSKAWRRLIDDPLNRRKLPQTLEGFFVLRGGHVDFMDFLPRSVPLNIDGCFSFLTKLPENEFFSYEDSCNGLFLFQHCRVTQSVDNCVNQVDTLCYIVCNPATKHWVTIPRCGCCLPPARGIQLDQKTFLVFDPAVSSNFHLIHFWKPPGVNPLLMVLSYSSETGMWSHNEQGQWEGWRNHLLLSCAAITDRAFVNGSLHLIVTDWSEDKMVAIDLQGKTKRMITLPAVAEGRKWHVMPCIAVSQGRVHYINHYLDAQGESFELYIWVLQDYDTQEWVLKDTVSFLKLFGRMTAGSFRDFEVVAIHPHCNVVFFRQVFIRQPVNRLITYDMDRKEVSVATFQSGRIAPYIPYFSESPVLTNKP